MSCGLGPCVNSAERGGKGCYLCDVVAKLPQQEKRQRDEVFQEKKPVKKKGKK